MATYQPPTLVLNYKAELGSFSFFFLLSLSFRLFLNLLTLQTPARSSLKSSQLPLILLMDPGS